MSLNQVASLFKKPLGLHVIQNPSGTWSFVGSVPVILGYTNKEGGEPSEQQIQDARQCGPQLAGIKCRSFPTKDEAIDVARQLGYEVK